MIDLTWNFPLLPGQGAQWQGYLERAVRALHVDDAQELRPTFRGADAKLRERAAKWLGSDAGCTWLTCGGHHGSLVSLLTAELAGETIAVERVTYTGILEQARMLRCPLVACAYDAEGLLPEALEAACAAGKVRVAYVMPTAHNPMGCVASLERREAIVAVARKHDVLLIEDDAYGYMVPEAAASYRVLAPERTFYVRGLSKSVAPQTRTGVLVAPERYAGKVEGAVKSTTTGTSLAHNTATMDMIEDGSWAAMVDAKLVEGRERNAAARALLGGAAAEGPACAWHLWVQVPDAMTGMEAQKVCGERGVMVSAGEYFAPVGEVAPRAVRLALGGEVERAKVLEGVGIVAGVVGAA